MFFGVETLLRDLKIAIVFLTRLPVRIDGRIGIGDLARTVQFFPLVGILVGATGGAVYFLASLAELPTLPGSILALAAMAFISGALHEDGLADTADALGTTDRAKALEIMHDSRIGTFGALAVLFAVLARLSAFATFWEPTMFLAAVIAAASFSRAVLPVVMLVQPSAREEGLAAETGRPAPERVLVGVVFGIAITFAALPPLTALAALCISGMIAALVALLLGRRFGGCTGDTLGAVQQLTEVAFLLTLVAQFV